MLDLDLNSSKSGKVLDLEGSPTPQTFGSTYSTGGPKTTPLWVAFGLLVAVLVAAAGYGYRQLKEGNIQLNQVPAMLKDVSLLDGRMTAIEAKLSSWSTDYAGLVKRVGNLERRTNANVLAARKHAETLTSQLEERMQDQIDERGYIVDHRLSGLETSQKSQQAEVAKLQQELSSARQELASLRQESREDLVGLHQQIAGNERAVDVVSHRLDTRRVDFEAAKARTYELAPGVSLHLSKTNVRHQRFGGWISLAPEGRKFWVDRHGIEQPVVFYHQKAAERCELVVTRVARESVTGYLMLPSEQGPTEKAAAPVAELSHGAGQSE